MAGGVGPGGHCSVLTSGRCYAGDDAGVFRACVLEAGASHDAESCHFRPLFQDVIQKRTDVGIIQYGPFALPQKDEHIYPCCLDG